MCNSYVRGLLTLAAVGGRVVGHMLVQSCVKPFLPSSENHSQNVPLPTLSMHYGAIFQPAIPKPDRNVFT